MASIEQLAMLTSGGLALPLSPGLLPNLSLLTSQNGALRMPSIGSSPIASLSGGQQQQQQQHPAFFGASVAGKHVDASSFAPEAAMLDPNGLLAASLLAGGPAAAASVDSTSLERHWLHRPQKQL